MNIINIYTLLLILSALELYWLYTTDFTQYPADNRYRFQVGVYSIMFTVCLCRLIDTHPANVAGFSPIPFVKESFSDSRKRLKNNFQMARLRLKTH